MDRPHVDNRTDVHPPRRMKGAVVTVAEREAA
jgi:hypothetical protein